MDVIEHNAIVTDINIKGVKVQLIDSVHCHSCSLKSACGSNSGTSELFVKIHNTDLKLHDTVKIILQQSLGFKALFYAYLLPFLILVLGMLLSMQLNFNDLQVGLSMLVSVLVYYLVLYGFKNKLESKFQIDIIKDE